MWIAADDGNSAITHITTAGVRHTYVLPVNTYPAGISSAPGDLLWYGGVGVNDIQSIRLDGSAGPTTTLSKANSYPLFSTLGPDANQYFVLNGTKSVAKLFANREHTGDVCHSGGEVFRARHSLRRRASVVHRFDAKVALQHDDIRRFCKV
jgi:hypothetical protein